MNISNELFFNLLCDFRKKEITSEEKSNLLLLYMKEHNLTQRGLAKQLMMPHSTLHDMISLRQFKKAKRGMHNDVFFYADRLMFVLTKSNGDFDERTIYKLNLLKSEIDKRILK